MALQKHLAIHDESVSKVDQREIRVEADSDLSFTRNTKPARRIGREKIGDAIERQTVQQRRQGGLNTRDTAPDAEEIVALFHLGRGRRMVAADDIDAAVSHGIPKKLLFGCVAQGRRTFRDGSNTLHVFTGERQIVRTGFDGDVRAAGARFESRRYAAPRADMDDVVSRRGRRSGRHPTYAG